MSEEESGKKLGQMNEPGWAARSCKPLQAITRYWAFILGKGSIGVF